MFFKNFIAAILLLHFGSSAGFCEKICAVPNSAGKVALTFDDGPSPETTPTILLILAQYDAHATFFANGQNAGDFPEILREIVRSGNEVGNHTFSHPDLLQSSETMVSEELERTQEIITGITGCRALVFRPPYSRINKTVEKIAERLGLLTVIWSLSPGDWPNPLPKTIAEQVLSTIKAGDIVVMHDGLDPKLKGKPGHLNTVAALPLILEGLRPKGLYSVTVSELLKQ